MHVTVGHVAQPWDSGKSYIVRIEADADMNSGAAGESKEVFPKSSGKGHIAVVFFWNLASYFTSKCSKK